MADEILRETRDGADEQPAATRTDQVYREYVREYAREETREDGRKRSARSRSSSAANGGAKGNGASAHKISMLPGTAEYPRNQWYVIAYSHEVTRELLKRDCLGDPILLYRTEGGRPVAMFDRCPHRGMPLSKGWLLGDRIQCGYHGFEYDADGRCVVVPSQPVAPTIMCARSYPLVEKWQWIWIWMGDPEQADPALIPDHEAAGLDNPKLFSEPYFMMEISSNYLLMYENLIDATHVTYIHRGLFDQDDSVAASPFRIEQDGQVVRWTREMKNEAMPPTMRQHLGMKGDRVDRTLVIEGYTGNLVVVKIHFTEPDYPETGENVSDLVMAVTPAGPRVTYQFVNMVTSKPNLDPDRLRNLRVAFEQDRAALEAIQHLFDTLGPERCPEYSVKADAGALRARRIIAQLIEREQTAN